MQGLICLWSGAIVDIPAGWHLCDGTNGTPDLRDKFVVGAGSTYAVGASGGSLTHTHTFTSNGHTHTMPAGAQLNAGAVFNNVTQSNVDTGTSDAGSSLPPYYALAWIMKL